MSHKTDIISASEVGQYTYCSIAWYLHRCGYEPVSEYFENGIQTHQHLGETIQSVQKDSRYARWLALIGYLLLILTIFTIFIGVILS